MISLTYIVNMTGAEVRPTGLVEGIRADVVNGVEVLMLLVLILSAFTVLAFIFCSPFPSRYGFGINNGSSEDWIKNECAFYGLLF